MSIIDPGGPASKGKPLDHDPAVCGLGEQYCSGCAAEPPEPETPPWGDSLFREYGHALEEWGNLDRQDRHGLSAGERERLAADKLSVFDRAAVVRAKGVNALLAILRWTVKDTPGQLAELLREPVLSVVEPDLTALAEAVLRTRGAVR